MNTTIPMSKTNEFDETYERWMRELQIDRKLVLERYLKKLNEGWQKEGMNLYGEWRIYTDTREELVKLIALDDEELSYILSKTEYYFEFRSHDRRYSLIVASDTLKTGNKLYVCYDVLPSFIITLLKEDDSIDPVAETLLNNAVPTRMDVLPTNSIEDFIQYIKPIILSALADKLKI